MGGDTTLVTTREMDQDPYVLLTPGSYPAREGRYYQRLCEHTDVPYILESARRSEFVAIDYETKGSDYSLPDLIVVGLGLAWDKGSCYLSWTELTHSARNQVIQFLREHQGLVAHNVYFDGGVTLRTFGFQPNWYACTYALYAMLANETPERKWGLKSAQIDMLGWAESNETELDEWLIAGGYYKGNRRISSDPEHLIQEYQAGSLKPDKAEMWRAPVPVLGKYCCLDAESCYLLFTEVLLPVMRQFPSLESFFRDSFMFLICVLIDQKFLGIEMDRPALFSRREELEVLIRQFSQKFMSHELVVDPISNIESEMRQKILLKEPARLKKNGEVSKNWINWKERLEIASRGDNPDYRFNMNSGPQLRTLLYGHLGNEVRIRTESGDPGVGIKALKHMGEPGLLLVERMYAVKELGFIDKYLELTRDRISIHPSFRTPGTITGRLSSKEPNLQQVPKSKAVMSLFLARPGHVWVDLDFSALESVVAAEFSQDPNLLALYADNAPENDVHLFVAAHVPGEMSRKILATGYTPHNPPPGTVSRAKKEAKAERSIAKTVVYACQYGAGVNKVMQTLENDEIYLPYDKVEAIHSTYWNTFARLKDFSRGLFYEWRRNGGFVLNGLGRPMAVTESYNKDILSRFIQSTGHDILVLYIRILCDRLSAAGIPWQPLLIDLHDATTVEVPEEHAEETVSIFHSAMSELNERLQGTIRLRGVPTVGRTLAEIKEPEE